MKIYNSLKLCPIFNFFESIEDVRYLLVLNDYFELPEIKENEEIQLLNIAQKLYDDYNHRIGGIDKIFTISKTITRTQYDQNYVFACLELLKYKYSGSDADFNWIETELKRLSLELNYNNEEEFYKELDRIYRKAKSLNNKIRRKTKEIEKIKKQSEQKSNDSDYLQLILLMNKEGVKLDIYKDSIETFIHARNMINSIINNKRAA